MRVLRSFKCRSADPAHRKRQARCIAAVSAALVMLGGCGDGSSGDTTPAGRTVVPSPEISVVGRPVPIADRPAPAIEATAASGDRFVMREHRGKVVVVNFWATWCAPCIVETPMLVETYEALRDSGLVVLGISLDREGFDVVRPFLDRFGVSYPVILDENDVASGFGGAYILPTTFFVDRSGQIVTRINGRLQEDVFARQIEELL